MPDTDNAAPPLPPRRPARRPAPARAAQARALAALAGLADPDRRRRGGHLAADQHAGLTRPRHHGDLPHRRGPDAGQDRRALQGRRYRPGEVRAAGAGPLARGGDHRADQGCRELRRQPTRASGWCGRASPSAACPGWRRCCPAPTSAWMPASRRPARAASPGWRCRRWSPPMPPGGSSCCARRTWARSTSARRSTTAACRWARWWPTSSSRTGATSRCGCSSTSRTTRWSPPTPASGTPAAWT